MCWSISHPSDKQDGRLSVIIPECTQSVSLLNILKADDFRAEDTEVRGKAVQMLPSWSQGSEEQPETEAPYAGSIHTIKALTAYIAGATKGNLFAAEQRPASFLAHQHPQGRKHAHRTGQVPDGALHI